MKGKTQSQIRPTDEPQRKDERPLEDEPPPFGGSWAKLYALVLINLSVLIVLFYIFTKAFE